MKLSTVFFQSLASVQAVSPKKFFNIARPVFMKAILPSFKDLPFVPEESNEKEKTYIAISRFQIKLQSRGSINIRRVEAGCFELKDGVGAVTSRFYQEIAGQYVESRIFNKILKKLSYKIMDEKYSHLDVTVRHMSYHTKVINVKNEEDKALIHKDGYEYITEILMERENVKGGVLQLYKNNDITKTLPHISGIFEPGNGVLWSEKNYSHRFTNLYVDNPSLGWGVTSSLCFATRRCNEGYLR